MPTYERCTVKLKFQLESVRYRQVGFFLWSSIELSRRVSTVQLPDGSYETCLFDPPNKYSEVIMTYKTEDEAILGHMRIIRNMGLTSAKYVV